MTRLPNPGSDDNTWGDILNSFLEVAHNPDGSLLPSALTTAGAATATDLSAKYTKPSAGIPASDLDSSTQSIINAVTAKYTKPSSGILGTDIASSTITAANIAASTITTAQLDTPTNTALAKASSSVQSVNTRTPNGSGAVTLTASDVSALPSGTTLSGLADTTAASTATNNQVLSYSSTTNSWVPATVSSSTVSDATASSKGIIELAGDLGAVVALPLPRLSQPALSPAAR
jgi:hypothetical protein